MLTEISSVRHTNTHAAFLPCRPSPTFSSTRTTASLKITPATHALSLSPTHTCIYACLQQDVWKHCTLIPDSEWFLHLFWECSWHICLSQHELAVISHCILKERFLPILHNRRVDPCYSGSCLQFLLGDETKWWTESGIKKSWGFVDPTLSQLNSIHLFSIPKILHILCNLLAALWDKILNQNI